MNKLTGKGGVYALLISAVIVLAGLTGCETTEGVGRDIQNAGEAIEDAAE
ncbi:entericidin A/B family lipoprotein [Halioxenophilus aromaticivorans]|uniref:Entericidin n=1 Tax=Halioxenophilus aromaticivorans TaxID=1306992 RepID=A0AAV3U8S2_9ALTE